MKRQEPESRWVERVEAWEKSGLSRAKWCREEGVGYEVFLKWVRRLRPETIKRREPKRGLFVELRDQSKHVEIEIRSGNFAVRVARGFDRELLGDCLRVLEGLTC